MNIRKRLLLGALAVVLSSCGGGGGEDGIQLTHPAVSVEGVPSGASVTVALNGNEERKTLTTDGTYRYATEIEESERYSLRVVSATGTSCLFPNAADSVSGVTPGDKTPVLDCLGGSGGGGGGSVGSASPVGNGPFRMTIWGFHQLSYEDQSGTVQPTSRLAGPVSLLDDSGNPLTGADLGNFTFFEDDTEIVDGMEHPLHVEPMPESNAKMKIAIAVDVSTSLSPSELDTIRNALKLFVANQPQSSSFALFPFDSSVTSTFTDSNGLPVYESDPSAVQSALDGIDTSLTQRDSATDLYGSMAYAGDNLRYRFHDEGELGYVIVITDGLHTANNDDPSSALDGDAGGLTDKLVFGIGIGNGYDEANLRKALGDPENDSEGAGDPLIKVNSASEVNQALEEVANRVEAMRRGLHHLYYRSPRRDDSDHKFRMEATPMDKCAGITNQYELCGVFWDYSSGDFQKLNNPLIVADIINPEPDQTVTYSLPDWQFCTASPNFNWTLTVNSGSASGTEINGGRAFEVQYGSAAPIDVDIRVEDTNATSPACFTQRKFTSP